MKYGIGGQELKHSAKREERQYSIDEVVDMENKGQLSYDFGDGTLPTAAETSRQSIEGYEEKGTQDVSPDFKMTNEGGTEKTRRVD